MKNSRKGFTLVELLIVIVVIGVLSTMMMLSSTEAVTSAKASNIVSNLRNLKTAALSWYADNLSTAETSGFKLSDKKSEIAKYMSNEGLGDYEFVGNQNSGTWFVYINNTDSRVGDKLISRKSAVGLWKVTTSNNAGVSADLTDKTGNVGMFIR